MSGEGGAGGGDDADADATADTAVCGTVEQLWTSPEDGAPMERHDEIECVEGGVRGDRYLRGTGHYSPYDVCEVTFVAWEALSDIRAETGIDLTDGRHRRNVVVRGVGVDGLRDLLGATFRVGGATFRGTRPRPPCAHVERVAGEEGVARALKRRRGGVCADVVDGGTVRVGDALELVEADPRTVGRSIADRLRGTVGGASPEDERSGGDERRSH